MTTTDEPMTETATDEPPVNDTDFLDDPAAAKRYLMWATVGLLALLAAVAMLQVYTNTSTAIRRFVAPDYQPLFQAVFNLVVLLLAVAGITTLLRRLQAAT